MHSQSLSRVQAWGHKPTPGTVLIAGSRIYPGAQPLRKYRGHVIGVDMLAGPGVDLVHDLSKPLTFSVSHVDCCSVLEHCADPFAVARTLSDALVVGGSMMLTVPYVWRVHGYPSDYWRFTVEGVRLLFPRIEWLNLAYAYDGIVSDTCGITKHEKREGLVRMPRAEVVGWGIRR